RRTDAHRHRLERAASGTLHEVRKADADVAAFAQRGDLAAREVVPARARERVVLASRVVAAVEHDRQPAARLELRRVRHLLSRNQIAPAHLGAVEIQLARYTVE